MYHMRKCVIDGCKNAIRGRLTKYARCEEHKKTCRRPGCDRETTGSNSLCNRDSAYFYRTGYLVPTCNVDGCDSPRTMGYRCDEHLGSTTGPMTVEYATAFLRGRGFEVRPIEAPKEEPAPINWGDF